MVQMLQDEVLGLVHSIVHRSFGSVGELKGVQKQISPFLQMGKHKTLKGLYDHGGQRDGSSGLKACEDGGCFESRLAGRSPVRSGPAALRSVP